jgi:hypothetical protein
VCTFNFLFVSGLTLPNGVLGHAGVTLTTKSIAHTPGSGKDKLLDGKTTSVIHKDDCNTGSHCYSNAFIFKFLSSVISEWWLFKVWRLDQH